MWEVGDFHCSLHLVQVAQIWEELSDDCGCLAVLFLADMFKNYFGLMLEHSHKLEVVARNFSEQFVKFLFFWSAFQRDWCWVSWSIRKSYIMRFILLPSKTFGPIIRPQLSSRTSQANVCFMFPASIALKVEALPLKICVRGAVENSLKYNFRKIQM